MFPSNDERETTAGDEVEGEGPQKGDRKVTERKKCMESFQYISIFP